MQEPNCTASLTKGIFVKKSSTKKKKKAGDKSKPLHNLQYTTISNSIEKHIQDIERTAYKETFNALVAYILECQSIFKLGEIREIPSAILVMGVNMPDHPNIFRLLEEQLNKCGIFATVQLQSKDCHTISSLMKKLVSGIFNQYQKMTKGNEDFKNNDFTFANLLTFYNDLPEPKTDSSPRKSPRKKSASSFLKTKPIVVLLQDVESFSPKILQDLILNCNIYRSNLPIVLVFGMSSAMVTLHNILPQKALSCLGIETFSSMTAIEYLNKIIQQVVLSPSYPLKFGHKVFRLIVDTVLYHDFSVTNLTHMIKLCLFEHFYENNNSSLCCDPLKIKETLQSFSRENFDRLRNIPSLKKFLDKNVDQKAKLKNKNDFVILIENMLMKHHTYYQRIVVLLRCLNILTKDLPKHPLGKHLRELYPLALEDNLTSLPCYLEAEKLLKMHSKDELCGNLKLCIQHLELVNNPDEELNEIKENLQDHFEKLEQLTDADYEKETIVSNSQDLENITSRSQFREKLRLGLKVKQSKFEKCREGVINYFSSVFQQLHPPSQLPLYEILYFDNALSLKRHMMATPRITLHRNLASPHLHLKCHCCQINSAGEITSTMPDICTLYKLHLEYGKFINMYDWLQAFKSTKENAEDEGSTDDDTDLNIRFMQAISELQFLGFIKPTTRKTDHVVKLTFS